MIRLPDKQQKKIEELIFMEVHPSPDAARVKLILI
jgi:hypothetical protein